MEKSKALMEILEFETPVIEVELNCASDGLN